MNQNTKSLSYILFLTFGVLSITGFILYFTSDGSSLDWYDYEEGVKKGKESDKIAFVNFYSRWNPGSRGIQDQVFGIDSIANLINDKFIPIQVDVSSDFGKSMMDSNKIESLPAFMFIAPNGDTEIISGIMGMNRLMRNLENPNEIFQDEFLSWINILEIKNKLLAGDFEEQYFVLYLAIPELKDAKNEIEDNTSLAGFIAKNSTPILTDRVQIQKDAQLREYFNLTDEGTLPSNDAIFIINETGIEYIDYETLHEQDNQIEYLKSKMQFSETEIRVEGEF